MQNRQDSLNRWILPLLEMDRRGFLRISTLCQSINLGRTARLVSHLGDGYLYALLALLIFWLEPDQGREFVQSALIAFSIELPLYLILKHGIRRARPKDSIVGFMPIHKPSDEFSFPSGHTSAAFVFALLLSAHYPQTLLPAFIIAGLIGASRVLLGVHYPSDIAAGILLGCGSAAVVLTI